MRFGTWNIRRLYGSSSLTTVTRKLSMYKLDTVGAQEVMWDNGGTVTTVDYTFFFLWKRKRNSIGNRFFVRYRRVQAVKTVESVSHKCYIYSSERSLANIVVLNAHAPTGKTSDHSKVSICEELEQVFDRHKPRSDEECSR